MYGNARQHQVHLAAPRRGGRQAKREKHRCQPARKGAYRGAQRARRDKQDGKCRANAGPRRYPNDIRACQWIAENRLVHKARHAKTEPARQRHHGTGQAQYRKGAHCHSVPRQQCLQGYGITAEIKCRTKGYKNAERCAQKAQRRAFAVIIHKIRG